MPPVWLPIRGFSATAPSPGENGNVQTQTPPRFAKAVDFLRHDRTREVFVVVAAESGTADRAGGQPSIRSKRVFEKVGDKESMNSIERHAHLPGDEHWPATHYTLYSDRLHQGEPGRQLCTEHVMEVYRDSLIRFYLGCSGTTGFPRLPKRTALLSDVEHAVDIVHEYFAKRAEQLIPKWVQHRSERAGPGPNHLRSFIKQDFRFHCLELYRLDRRYHGKAQELGEHHDVETLAVSNSVQKETTELELTALIRLAVESTLLEFAEGDRAELRVLVENRVLLQRRYKDFETEFQCTLQNARQKVVRFRRRLVPVIRDLIRQQGDSIAELMGDLL